MHILVINGSPRGEVANTKKLLAIASTAAKSAGATVTTVTLANTPLPLYRPKKPLTETAKKIQKFLLKADALIIGCPEYHGSVTGTLKNFFDHFYEEFAGKLVGLIASTGGSQGQSVLSHLRDICLYLHCWTLPYNASAKEADFENGELVNDNVRERVENVGYDTAVYGQVLAQQFKKSTKGFATWHD